MLLAGRSCCWAFLHAPASEDSHGRIVTRESVISPKRKSRFDSGVAEPVEFTVPEPAGPAHTPSPPTAPRVTVWTALRSHPIVALAPVLLLMGGAVAAALVRSPSYTADVRLSVGRLEASPPEMLVGYTQATESLAETYSRSVAGDAVVNRTARVLGISPRELRSRISAAPIPESPVFRIRAEAASGRSAIATANAVSDTLGARARRRAASNESSNRLLERYRGAVRELELRRSTLALAVAEYESWPYETQLDNLNKAKSEVAAAQLRARTVGETYRASQSTAGSTALISVIERAHAARSDRYSVLQLLAFAALVAGLALGACLALWRAQRRLKRQIG